MFVCVLNKNKKPLNMCHPARARKLLKEGKAVIHRKYPMVIRLKFLVDDTDNSYDYDIRLDPGSKVTGLAVVKNKNEVLGLMELKHKQGISESLEKRANTRRSRRNRKTGYRRSKWKEAIRLHQRYTALKKQGKPCKKPSFGKSSKEGWIAPSLEARINQTKNLMIKLKRFIPLTSIGMELVKFDTQKMQNANINGVEYQQGELAGYEVREYLLEKFNRTCAYCNATDIPLEIEHVIAKSRKGSNRISNLTIACRSCNEEKGNLLLEEWINQLKKSKKKIDQTRLTNIPKVLKQLKEPLKDAAVVNTTKQKLLEELKKLGLPVYIQTGAKTKMQRIQNKLEKEHYYDALCVGEITKPFHFKTDTISIFEAIGRGDRQMARVDKYGFPLNHLDQEKYNKNGERKGHRPRRKTFEGFQTGDMVKAVVTKGKKIGTHVGKLSIRHNGYFNIKTDKKVVEGIAHRYCTLIQRNDGWNYQFKKRTI